MDAFVIRRHLVDPASCTVASAEMSEDEHAGGKIVDAKRVANNRCYLKSAVQAVTFLVVNKKHKQEIQDDFSKEVFHSFYQRALGEDESLTDITHLLPPDTQYISAEFQVSIVRTLVRMVLNKIREKYKESDSKSFCVKGCIRHIRDKGEIMSLVLRFMNEGKPEEHLIGQLQLDRKEAEYIADRILNYLTEYNLNPRYIVSQCYDDGTSFSGCRDGLHVALQRKLNQYIPNIHCDHRPLSLVLVHTIQEEPNIGNFFDLCHMAENFLQHPQVSERNDRFTHPPRTPFEDLSGYYHLIRNIVSNFESISGLLSDMAHDHGVPEELRINASHLLPLLQEKYFIGTGKFLLDLLTATELADMESDKFLSRRPQTKYLPFEAEVTRVAWGCLETIRTDPLFLAGYYTDAGTIPLSQYSIIDHVSKHQTIVDSTMADSLACATANSSQSDSESLDIEDDSDFTLVEQKAFGNALLHILDVGIREMESRVPTEDRAIIEAILALFPSSQNFLDMDVCLPLVNIGRVCRTSLAKQIQGAKSLLHHKISANMDLAEACEVVFKHSASFPAVYEVYVTALLMGIPASDCETSFPVPVQSATVCEHETNVAIVAHEHMIASSLCMDEFVVEFSRHDTRLLL